MNQRLTQALVVCIGAAVLALTGCAGDSCTVEETSTGARIVCEDGTSVDIDDGTDGASCSVTDNGDGTKTISCTDGTTITVADGSNGTSCTVTEANGVKTIKCADGTSVTVRDGVGETGGGVEIVQHHGEAFLKSEGEFSKALPNPKVFVKPTITSVTADEAGKLTVNFKVDTLADQPYKILTSANVGVAKLVPAGAGEASPHWVSYLYRTETVPSTGTYPNPAGTTRLQATRESAGTGATNGTLTNNGDGTYTYVAKVNLATAKRGNDLVGYDRALTHRVTLSFGGHSGPTGNTDFDFVPNGAAITTTRKMIPTQVCQNCHGFEFHGHGGDRLTLENCVTCHNPGNEDANGGESIEMAPMIHAIHAGGERATIAGADGIVWDDPVTTVNEAADNGTYAIWGNGQTKHTWWNVEFPAVAENCTVCHQGTLPDVNNWKTKPSRAACGGCHDDVDFAGGTNHVVQTQENCTGCHPATGATSVGGSIEFAHDWVQHDPRKQEEFTVEMSLSAPANGTHYVTGEAPLLSIVLKKDGTAIDHTTVVQDDAAEGCVPTGTPAVCPAGDGKFAAALLFVSGPRALRVPVLTTPARAQLFSATTGTFDLSAGGDLKLKVDLGETLVTYDSSGGDKLVSGTITVPVSGGTFANAAAATTTEVVTWLNSNAAFKARAIAWDEGGKVGIRTRSLGKVTALQLVDSNAATVIFGADRSVKMPGTGGYTVAAQLDQRINTAQNDPKANRTAEKITYQLDPVDDLAPGTYVAYVEISDRGRISETNYGTPSVGKITFQVKQAAEEKQVADSCNSCHQGPDGKGYVLDYSRHNKKFDSDAVDGCGSCHDYQPAYAATGEGWAGARAISKRVHAVHFGSSLNYPLATVDYPNGDPVKGRNWSITYPMDVRNCESCHSSATSGSWKTEPGRLACLGCHDSDAAKVHARLNVYDPTPADVWSGDEQEACAACHQ